MNNAGQFVGINYPSGTYTPYVNDNGAMALLSATNGHQYADPWQINDTGTIVGISYDLSSPNYVADACIWTRSGIQWAATVLPGLAPGAPAGIYGTTNANVHLGTSQDAGGVFRACKWVSGIASELAAPTPNAFACANSMNSSGQYIGHTRNGSPLTSSAYLFDGASLVSIPGLPGFAHTIVHRINDSGTVIGWSFNGDGANWGATFIECRALVFRGGTTSALNSLIHSAPGAGWDIRQVWDINSFGQIAGIACVNGTGPNCTGGVWRAALLKPCYSNCDNSTNAPILTANDFQCFLDKFAGGDPYANCDQSAGTPALTANDFQCFLNKYAAGCS